MGCDSVDRVIQQTAYEPTDLQRLRKLSENLLEPELAIHVIENLPEGVVVVRRDASIFYVNREAEFMFEYARHELYERHLQVLVPQRYHEDHSDKFGQYLEKPHIRTFPNQIDTVGLTKAGKEFKIMIALLPVVIAAGFFIVATIRKK